MEQQQNVKPIPALYQGRYHWTAKLLKAMSAVALKKAISDYGVNAINAAVSKNAAQGVK